MSHDKNAEIDRNLRILADLLPQLIPDHDGDHALMRNGTIIDFFRDPLDAQIAGNQQFQDTLFSIQRVQNEPEHLGYFAHAIDPRTP